MTHSRSAQSSSMAHITPRHEPAASPFCIHCLLCLAPFVVVCANTHSSILLAGVIQVPSQCDWQGGWRTDLTNYFSSKGKYIKYLDSLLCKHFAEVIYF